MDRRGPRSPNQQQGFEPRQDRLTSSGDRGTLVPRGRFAWPDLHCRTFMLDKQCAACKRIGHKAINCNMLAIALFVDCYVHHSLSDSDQLYIESKWLAHWKDRLGQPARSPRQVMRSYCDTIEITPDMLDLTMD
jgi:hypothetical protein